MKRTLRIQETTMQVISTNKAKTHCGNMLLPAQKKPTQMNKHNKAVAVVISEDEHQEIEALKLAMLQARAKQTMVDIDSANIQDGDTFFDQLGVEHHNQ